ncbi:MAG TPA: N-acetyl-gamma-glutamyl-phosphate reductase [Chthoniobacteraceae bacterium]|jgi:N-acetyl-gamma-glutamyl-phosphate reductase|nr:N-acetyl-gamma-glutamyl-phosphate reductase [Chthoniobacteraceae bacterium]
MNLVNVAIAGATGYSGEELVRLLIRHPGIELTCVTSRGSAGSRLEEVFPRFQAHKYSALKFVASEPEAIVASGAKCAFLALPHGTAAPFAQALLEAGVRVVDLSADFRIKDPAIYREFYGHEHPAPELLERSVYGIPELYREPLRTADLVASAGCYPTSILLPLHPLLKAGLLEPASIVVSSMSGVSGAGRNVAVDYLYAECNENARPYGVPKHRHLGEIEQELSLAAGGKVTINFTPHLIPVTRGIITTIFAMPRAGVTPQAITEALHAAYREEIFVRLQGEKGNVELKNVAHSNFIDIAWRHDPRTGRIILMSAEDNLVKGAAGQAVQNLNVMCGFAEATAL